MKKILVVEDEPVLLKLLGLELGSKGYEVVTAIDGEKALELAQSLKPSLIILDIMLPRMDGYKVCGLLKNDSRYSSIPVILFSAKAMEKDKQMGDEVGADAYITKPYDSAELLAKIKELT